VRCVSPARRTALPFSIADRARKFCQNAAVQKRFPEDFSRLFDTCRARVSAQKRTAPLGRDAVLCLFYYGNTAQFTS
jgi:hypothetical protein